MGCFGRSKLEETNEEESLVRNACYDMRRNTGEMSSQMASILMGCSVQGVAQKRHFRDVLFALLYLVFWGGMIYIAVLAFQQGKFPSASASTLHCSTYPCISCCCLAELAHSNPNTALLSVTHSTYMSICRSPSASEFWNRLSWEHLRAEELLERLKRARPYGL